MSFSYNTRVRIIYTTRKEPVRNAENMFMIPLPNSPQGYQDFAAVTRKQKKMIDRILRKQAKKRSHLLSPEVMRDWLEKFSLDNIGESFRRMHDMQCGGTYHGYVCLLHIVSIVKDFDKVQQLQRVIKLDENTYVTNTHPSHCHTHPSHCQCYTHLKGCPYNCHYSCSY